MYWQEYRRANYVSLCGPLVVASLIGASAPPSGLGGVNGLCMDRAWQTLAAKITPDFEHPPSIFETPDPHRPFRMEPTFRWQDLPDNTASPGTPCD